MDLGRVFIDGILATIGPVTAAYAISAIGLNLQFGYTGLLNFGHVAFMLVGAYGMAITVDLGGPLWLGVPVGILAAAFLGLLLGLPTLRLRADYLAIMTIAAGEIIRLVVRSVGAAAHQRYIRHPGVRRWLLRTQSVPTGRALRHRESRCHRAKALGHDRRLDGRSAR